MVAAQYDRFGAAEYLIDEGANKGIRDNVSEDINAIAIN